jgi:hypothetical protein
LIPPLIDTLERVRAVRVIDRDGFRATDLTGSLDRGLAPDRNHSILVGVDRVTVHLQHSFLVRGDRREREAVAREIVLQDADRVRRDLLTAVEDRDRGGRRPALPTMSTSPTSIVPGPALPGLPTAATPAPASVPGPSIVV